MEGGGSYPVLQKLEWTNYSNISKYPDVHISKLALTSIVIDIWNHIFCLYELSPRDRDIAVEHIPTRIIIKLV